MKTLLKYLSIVLLVVAASSCIDELDETIYKGNVQFNLSTTTEVKGEAEDYTVKAKLYRKYNEKLTIIELDVDSIYEDGSIVTESYEIEHGNYELQSISLLNDGETEFCGIDKDDDRAPQIGEESYLPIAKNVLENDTTVFALELVEFDETKEPEVEEPPLSIAEFLALTDGSVATINAYITEVVTNASGKVSYLMMKDSNGDEIKVYGVYNISDIIYEVGDVLFVTGKRTGTNGEDGLALEADSEHSIVADAKANSIAAFLKLADGTVGTIEAEVIEVSVNPSYGTVTSLLMKDKSGDEILAYGVFKISDEIYTVGQELRITADRDSYNGEDQMSFSSDAGHSIEILSGGTGDEGKTIADFLNIEVGTVGTIKAEVKEVSVNPDYGTVTYLIMKDSKGDEIKAYGVFKVSDIVYEVGQTLILTGKRDEYSGEAQLSFASESGHSIVIVEEGGDTPVVKGSKDTPYTVEEARDKQDESTAWVEGYIIGYIVYDAGGNHTVSSDPSAAVDTNIAIASSASETDASKMLFVQLSGSDSAPRTQLGLASTSGASVGYHVKLNGQLENYFGDNPGLKGISTADQFEIITE